MLRIPDPVGETFTPVAGPFELSMATKPETMSKEKVVFRVVHPQAAGIDIGSRSHWVSVGEGKEKVREFGVYTPDLMEMAGWLKSHEVETIAMESTGFYWKSAFLLLQSQGFKVYLVNAKHVKNVRGKKSDVSDCQWLWQLHSAGLLTNSFQPDVPTEELRTYARHRETLVESANRQVAKMQKAMTVMNIHLSVVLSDITGKSGQLIIKAILEGERDAYKLANLADGRVKAERSELVKALRGNFQRQHLFELQQAWNAYHFFQQQIKECELQMEAFLEQEVARLNVPMIEEPMPPPRQKKKMNPKSVKIDMAQYGYRLSGGLDLLDIEGLGPNTLLSLISEVGLSLDAFPTAKHFSSWLGLSPNKKTSGGKVLSNKTRKHKNRLAQAFRHAANTIGNQKSGVLNAFFRRVCARSGRRSAITATARKLATIIYSILTKKVPYNPPSNEAYQQKMREYKIKQMKKTMQQMNISLNDLVPAA